MKKLSFVLAGDNNYIPYIETTLKSILYHHRNCKIYILNEDILPEWFRKVNKLSGLMDSEIIDVRLCNEVFEWDGPSPHINKMAYARYFIPKYVEEDTVLYLDSDIIVDRNLEDLFTLELGDNLIAGVIDHYEHSISKNLNFVNSGVLLINCKEWRKLNLEKELVKTTNDYINGTINSDVAFYGDQTVINLVCKGKVYFLEGDYNIQVPYYRADVQSYNKLTPVSNISIIHYLYIDKPWNSSLQMPFKDRWWYYNTVDSLDISLQSERLLQESNMKNKKCFILTNSQDFEHIEYLLRKLPNCIFSIAAYTDFGSHAMQLQSYSNIRLYPKIFEVEIERLLIDCDFYLNINHGGQVAGIIRKAKDINKLVVSFDNIDGKENADIVFENSDPDKMVQFILNMKD